MSTGTENSRDQDETLVERVADLEDLLDQELDRLTRIIAKLRGRVHDVEQRIDDLDDGGLDVDDDVIEDLKQDIEELRHVVNVDLDGKRYQQLTRDDKVREIQAALLSEALGRQTQKAAMNYTDVRWLFNGKPSTGHTYTLMEVAGQGTGFDYQERDEKNRIVVDAGEVPEGVKQSLQVSRSE